jgi:hypothetical protein
MKLKILIGACVLVLLFLVFLVPGWWPIRAFDGFFYTTCKYLIRGEFSEYQSTSFVGLGGLPIRHDYIECGRGVAIDANHICSIVPVTTVAFGEAIENPLGREMDDECAECQYGALDIKSGDRVIGRSCRPYKFLWRWYYKSAF